jgi:tetratricopeptide (TPR) repeat protein
MWRVSGKVLLAVVSIGIGATIYVLSPTVRLVPLEYWASVAIYVLAAEVAWYLAEMQTIRGLDLLARAGLRAVSRANYNPSSRFGGTGLTVGAGFLDVGADRDVERDIQVSLLNALTRAGADNRFEMIAAPVGAGKTTMLYRLGLELLKRKYLVYMLGDEVSEASDVAAVLARLARRSARLFVLIDDIELQAGIGLLLEGLLEGDDKITIVAGCSRQGYDTLLRGGEGRAVAARDLVSLANVHNLRITPRETQALTEKLAPAKSSVEAQLTAAQRQAVTAGASDLLSLKVGLLHGLLPAGVALEAVAQLGEPERELLYKLCIISLCGHDVMLDEVAPVIGKDAGDLIDTLAATKLVVRYGKKVYPPHPAVSLVLLRSPDLLAESERMALAEKVIRGLSVCRRPLANAVMRGVLYMMDREFVSRLWVRCRDVWTGDLTRLSPGTAVEDLVPLLYLAGDYEPAADLCREYLADETLGNRASFQLALCLYRLGSHEAAGEILDWFLSQRPYGRVAHLNSTLTNIGQGKYEKAEQHLRVLEETDTRLPGLHYLLGYVAELQGQTERAMAEYQEARAQYGHDNAALWRLASLKVLTEASGDAIRLYEAGLQQDPGHVEYYGGLAVAHYLSGNNSRAMVQSARAIHAGIDPAVVRKAVARACMEYGLYDQALNELRNCLTYMPDDIEAQILLGHCLHSQNDLSGAKDALEAAVASAPESLMARQELASCLLDLKEYENAEAVLREVVDSPMTTPEIYVLSAMVAANRGDVKEQGRWAHLALDAGDESGWAWFIYARALGGEEAAEIYETAANRLAQTAVTGNRVESAAAYQAIAVCKQGVGDEAGSRQAAARARGRIIGSQYAGEPVLSALVLRSVSSGEFMEQLRQFGLDEKSE